MTQEYQKSFSVPAKEPEEGRPAAAIEKSRLSVQMKNRAEQRRKLSESRGVILPNIEIVPPNLVGRGRSYEGYTRDEASSTLRTPITAASPVGTVVRFRNNSTTNTATNTLAKHKALDVRIFLPDNRAMQFSVDGGRTVSSVVLAHLCAEYLQLPADVACQVFSLWMVSFCLEVALKPHHLPFAVRKCWPDLLQKYTSLPEDDCAVDEPLIMYRRNVFLTNRQQRQLAHGEPKVAELLYVDARESVLMGRQPMRLETSLELAAVDMAIQWGPYNKNKHTIAYIRECLGDVLPECHLSSAAGFSLFGLSSCGGVCQPLLERYKELSHTPAHELHLMYLETCMTLHTYGCAYFWGQIERAPPLSASNKGGLHRWLQRSLSGATGSDIPVLLAINRHYINIIDQKANALVFSHSLLDCQWKTVRSSNTADRDCLPSVFLHFAADEPISDEQQQTVVGSHLLQLFTHQAPMIEALLNTCFDVTFQEFEQSQADNGGGVDAVDGVDGSGSPTMSPVFTDSFLDDRDSNVSSVTNKLDRFCVANLDASGRCVQAMGSLKMVLQDDLQGEGELQSPNPTIHSQA